ncbi:MAG: recombinase family protein [candidate division Zixibacteria bacterium]|nr:recombinase family protein [candidate division Zixibacteria bacterium]
MTNKQKKEKAVLYVRVSSKPQEEKGFSLDAQEKKGKEYAAKNGLEIVKLWNQAESAWRSNSDWSDFSSLSESKRDGFGEMLAYVVSEPSVKHIIFDSPDRMTRNEIDKMKIFSLTKAYNKTVHFTCSGKVYNSNSSFEDFLLLSIEVSISGKGSDDTSRKAKIGMKEKAEQGGYPGPAPFGYINTGNKKNKWIEIDPEKSLFVKRAFELMASRGHSLSTLADKLNDEGFRSNNGTKLYKSTLQHILRNPVHYGAFRWDGTLYKGNHEPIITKSLFDQVQIVLSGNGNYSKPRNLNFSFNNLMRCKICGCKVIGERARKIVRNGSIREYIYYHCTFSKGKEFHSRKYLNEQMLIDGLDEIVRPIQISDDLTEWMTSVLETAQYDTHKFQQGKLKGLRLRKAKCETRLSNFYDAKFDGELDGDVFMTKEKQYREQLFDIDGEITKIESSKNDFLEKGQKILELCKRLYDLYLVITPEMKAQLLRVVASNFVFDGVTVTATYNKPFDVIVNLPSRTIKLPEPCGTQNFQAHLPPLRSDSGLNSVLLKRLKRVNFLGCAGPTHSLRREIRSQLTCLSAEV